MSFDAETSYYNELIDTRDRASKLESALAAMTAERDALRATVKRLSAPPAQTEWDKAATEAFDDDAGHLWFAHEDAVAMLIAKRLTPPQAGADAGKEK